MSPLMTLLSDSQHSLQELSSCTSLDDFCELLFHAAGLESFEFNNFDLESFNRGLRNQPPSASPLIFDKSFLKRFNQFMVEFFCSNNCEVLFNKEEMGEIIELLKFLANQCWDSFRHVAIHTVIGLMSIILELEETPDELDADLIHYLIDFWNRLFAIWKPCNRDVDSAVRRIVYESMYNWAEHHNKLLFASKSMIPALYVPRSLRDVHLLRLTPFKTLEKLTTAVIDTVKQKTLIHLVLQDLIESIKEDEQLALVSLNILKFSAQNFDLKLSAKDFGLIFRHCYDAREDIRKSTAKFSFLYFFSSNPNDMLHNFILFHQRSLFKNHKEYVDLFYERTKNNFTWSVWRNYLEKCHSETISTATGIFYYWVKKVIIDFPSEEEIDEMDDNINPAKSFTEAFGSHWVNFFEFYSSSKNKESIIDFIKIVEFFADNMEFDDFLIILKKMIQLDGDKDVIEASCFYFSVIYKKYSEEDRRSSTLRSIYKSKMDFLFLRFVDYLKCDSFVPNYKLVFQVDAMTRFLKFDDDMWEDVVDLMTDIDNEQSEIPNIKESKKVTVISVLFNLLMNKLQHLKTNTKHWTAHAMICVEWCDNILSYIKPISLSSVGSYKYMALYMLTVIIENFGPHMKYHKNEDFHILASDFEINLLPFVLEASVEVFNVCSCTNKDFQNNSTPQSCCDVIKKIGHILSEGMLDIKIFYQNFFSCVTLDSSHYKLIVLCFQKYCTNFPGRIPILAKIIFHKSFGVYHNSINSGHSTKTSFAAIKRYYDLILGDEWSLLQPNYFNLFSNVAENIIEFALKSDKNIPLFKWLTWIARDQSSEIQKFIVDLLKNHPKRCSGSFKSVLDDLISSMKL